MLPSPGPPEEEPPPGLVTLRRAEAEERDREVHRELTRDEKKKKRRHRELHRLPSSAASAGRIATRALVRRARASMNPPDCLDSVLEGRVRELREVAEQRDKEAGAQSFLRRRGSDPFASIPRYRRGSDPGPVHTTDSETEEVEIAVKQVVVKRQPSHEVGGASSSVTWPDVDACGSVTLMRRLRGALAAAVVANRAGEEGATRKVFPEREVFRLLDATRLRLRSQAHVVDVHLPVGGAITVVGDIHGQFQDLCELLDLEGMPMAIGRASDSKRSLIFNGDFVDRGSCGVEVVLLLCALKVIFPNYVHLLRGNHESQFCMQHYGFRTEVIQKYGFRAYDAFVGAFQHLPVAAVVNEECFVVHGGLFRKPPPPSSSDFDYESDYSPVSKREGSTSDGDMYGSGSSGSDAEERVFGEGGLELGAVSELRTISSRALKDPEEESALEDCLWSDPDMTPGLRANPNRGVGLLWGPDISEQFLRANHLSLIVRSHEGPDARAKPARQHMRPMHLGFTIDHDLNDTNGVGRCVTVFSAPNYPEGPKGHGNRASVLTLRWHSLPSCQCLLCRENGGHSRVDGWVDLSSNGQGFLAVEVTSLAQA